MHDQVIEVNHWEYERRYHKHSDFRNQELQGKHPLPIGNKALSNGRSAVQMLDTF